MHAECKAYRGKWSWGGALWVTMAHDLGRDEVKQQGDLSLAEDSPAEGIKALKSVLMASALLLCRLPLRGRSRHCLYVSQPEREGLPRSLTTSHAGIHSSTPQWAVSWLSLGVWHWVRVLKQAEVALSISVTGTAWWGALAFLRRKGCGANYNVNWK